MNNTCPCCGSQFLFPVVPHGTLDVHINDWLDDLTLEHRSRGYVEQLRLRFKKYIVPFFDSRHPASITTKDLVAFKRSLLLRGLAPKTAKHVLSGLSALLNHLALNGGLDAVPRFPAFRVQPSREKQWLSPETQRRALDVAEPEDALIFRTMFETGERVSEACAHRPEDLQDGGIRVCRAFDDYGAVKATKTGTDDLRPLSGALYGLLKERCRATNPGQFLFLRNGRPFNRRRLRYRWERTCRLAGVPRIPLSQATRHSKASRARAELELNMRQSLKDVLNHSSAQTTMDFYALDEGRRL